QFRSHRLREYRRSASHRGKGPVLGGAILGALGAGAKRHRQADRSAEDGGDVSGPAHRRITGRLVIATHNPGKLAEMRDLLAPYGIDAISAGELKLKEPDETGMTFRDNARIKAEAAAKATGLPAFADDSGLAVDALDGAPGIHSARWAGPDKNFSRAMATIEDKLHRLGATAPERRKAHFVSALCVAWPDGHSEE